VVDRWRLEMVFRMFYSLDYALPFGEEVGLVHEGPPWYREPMWWPDLPNPESKRPTYRSDFFALVRAMNTLRGQLAPLRRGEFKPVLADRERKLWAYSRLLPREKVILVQNHGNTREWVKITAGNPGQLVTVLRPQLDPAWLQTQRVPPKTLPDVTKIPEMPIGTDQQITSGKGEIGLWMDSMSVSLLLISDEEAR
jgi:hypothetical protein